MQLLPRLLDRAHALGFQVRGGDLFRDPRVHGGLGAKVGYGHAKSAHKQKLAIDLLLFRAGKYLSLSEDYKALGEWWKQQHPLNRWGGDFPAPDGNHFSMTRDGIS